MISFLKSEVFALFAGGFTFGAIALFALQPHETRAEITEQLTNVAAHIQTRA